MYSLVLLWASVGSFIDCSSLFGYSKCFMSGISLVALL